MAGTGSKEQRNIFTVIVNHVPNFSPEHLFLSHKNLLYFFFKYIFCVIILPFGNEML
jgi:hypothetical protein